MFSKQCIRTARNCVFILSLILLLYVAVSLHSLGRQVYSFVSAKQVQPHVVQPQVVQPQASNDSSKVEQLSTLWESQLKRFEAAHTDLSDMKDKLFGLSSFMAGADTSLRSIRDTIQTVKVTEGQVAKALQNLPSFTTGLPSVVDSGHFEHQVPAEQTISTTFAMPTPSPSFVADQPSRAPTAQQPESVLPMVALFGEGNVRTALAERWKWFRGIIKKLDLRGVDNLPNWDRYDYFGPVFKMCPQGKLQSLGRDDELKKVCHLQRLIDLSGQCEIISVGSEGKWDFEREVVKRFPQCRVHTFDCTGYYPAPREISSRVFSYQKCIAVPGHSDPNYVSYDKILQLANIKGVPTYLKIDVEGFEWNVFPTMIANLEIVPEQIAFEIHCSKLRRTLGWKRPLKTKAEIAIFGEMMFRAGYVPIDRRDNTYGSRGEATEFLLARVAMDRMCHGSDCT